jgi:regulator of replication initiation timing
MTAFCRSCDLLTIENAELRADNDRLRAGMREYACTGTDHPCGCYTQFLSERADNERLRVENKGLRELILNASANFEHYGLSAHAMAYRRALEPKP